MLALEAEFFYLLLAVRLAAHQGLTQSPLSEWTGDQL